MQSLKVESKEKYAGIIGNFLLHFLVLGFPIQSFIPFALNIDSNPVNVGFRIILLLLSLGLIVFTTLKKINKTVQIGWFCFIIFWVIYGIRLIYDLEIKQLAYLDTDKFFVYSFAFGVCLIPSIAVYKSAKYFNHLLSVRMMFWILIISNLCLFYAVLSFGNWNLAQVILSRANVNVEINGETKSIINPIAIGFFGELMTVMAIHFLNFPIYQNKKFKIILYGALLLGVLNLTLGASRGPLLSLIILLVLEIYFIMKHKKDSKTFFMKLIVGVSIFIVFLTSFIVTKLQSGDIELINRTFQIIEGGEINKNEERTYLFDSAIRQFKENPIIGDAFVTKYFNLYNSYSHNLILDVLMATGIIGFMFFVGMLYYIFLNSRYIVFIIKVNANFSVYLLIFTAHFLSGMVSGGLFMSNGFWMLSALLLVVNPYVKNANS
jgi:O-antigen ligase